MSGEVMWGEEWAPVYKKYTGIRGRTAEVDETVTFLHRYAGESNALELGIGDGRVAVPLSKLGVKVDGIDNSDSMLKLLSESTDLVNAWKGNISEFQVEKRYGLVFCIYNTFTLVDTREGQLCCLRSAADALSSEGVLMIEIVVPELDGIVNGQKVSTLLLDDENTILIADVHDPMKQNLTSTLLWFSGTSVKRLPHRVRYVYHQELDTMAECVGLKLSERWEDWAGGAFTEKSKRHVSVYRRNGL
ncbi:class I SAM-dependent methyltransferase [Mesorhizobium sp. M0187]|uniref:class I SAM-dependent methyltransferase n=1 Tax=Mesorhizobium sp. M0187 TaxID=2956908 RepID=UPI00333B9BAB